MYTSKVSSKFHSWLFRAYLTFLGALMPGWLICKASNILIAWSFLWNFAMIKWTLGDLFEFLQHAYKPHFAFSLFSLEFFFHSNFLSDTCSCLTASILATFSSKLRDLQHFIFLKWRLFLHVTLVTLNPSVSSFAPRLHLLWAPVTGSFAKHADLMFADSLYDHLVGPLRDQLHCLQPHLSRRLYLC